MLLPIVSLRNSSRCWPWVGKAHGGTISTNSLYSHLVPLSFLLAHAFLFFLLWSLAFGIYLSLQPHVCSLGGGGDQ